MFRLRAGERTSTASEREFLVRPHDGMRASTLGANEAGAEFSADGTGAARAERANVAMINAERMLSVVGLLVLY